MVYATWRMRSSARVAEEEGEGGGERSCFSTTGADSATQAAEGCYWSGRELKQRRRQEAWQNPHLPIIAIHRRKKKSATYNIKGNVNNVKTVNKEKICYKCILFVMFYSFSRRCIPLKQIYANVLFAPIIHPYILAHTNLCKLEPVLLLTGQTSVYHRVNMEPTH